MFWQNKAYQHAVAETPDQRNYFFQLAGYLNQLHDQGFCTFDHIIDESYNTEQDHATRLTMIIEQVNKIKDIKLTDTETVKRTMHNHNLFFDTQWSRHKFNENLFQPMLELL